MTIAAATRVRFVDGDRLDLADLVTEQTYHFEQFRRHLIGAHRWGILKGLALDIDPDGRLLVGAGMAVDGYGRSLVLANPRPILPQLFVDRDADQLDLYLIYRARLERSPSRGACPPEGADRIVELPFVQAERPDPTRPHRWTPPGVPEGDLGFGPERDPAPAGQPWPVFLGRVTYDPEADPPFAVDAAGRRYAGVIAERIESPSGDASLQVGRDLDGSGANRLAFRVRGQRDPLLEVDAKGDATVRGNVTLEGDLVIREAAWAFENVIPEPSAARPASIYRTTGKTMPAGANQSVDTDELRIELPPSPSGGKGRFVIGSWSKDDKKFKELLSVDADGVVTITGDLVEKVSTAPPKQSSVVPGFGPEAMQLIQAALFNAITGSGGAIANVIASGGAAGPFVGPGLGLSAPILANFFAQLFGGQTPHEELVAKFAEYLRENYETLAEQLQSQLEDDSEDNQ